MAKKHAGNPTQTRWAHPAHSGSRSERRIRFILPTRRFHHVININITLTANNIIVLCTMCFLLFNLNCLYM